MILVPVSYTENSNFRCAIRKDRYSETQQSIYVRKLNLRYYNPSCYYWAFQHGFSDTFLTPEG